MCVRDFHLVGIVGNNEECSVISTNILMLVRLFLMDYSGLAVGWREAWCSRIRIRSLDRAIPILGLISQFSLICCYSLIAGVVCRFNFLSCNSFSLIVSGKGVYWTRFSSNEIVDTRSMLRQKTTLGFNHDTLFVDFLTPWLWYIAGVPMLRNTSGYHYSGTPQS